MISKRRCPHTGVVNFFTTADPLIAVGSVSETAAPDQFTWCCYLDHEAAGTARDMSMAEANLRSAIASRRDLGVRAA